MEERHVQFRWLRTGFSQYARIILLSHFYGMVSTMTELEKWCIKNGYFSYIDGIYRHRYLPHVSVICGSIAVHLETGPRYMSEEEALQTLQEAQNGMSKLRR